MSGLLTGTALFASFLGGMVALFAPCCISVMLPSYFATSFGRRLRLVLVTFVFAAGVATVILPIALGAAGIGSLVQQHHTLIFGAGGLMMVAFGVFTLAGGKLALPMPGMRASSGHGPAAVYSLGVFSGVASSCCAPVLAGVIALSGLSGSYPVALAIGVAYVFGMVFPLFLLALVWDRLNWGESRILRGRSFRLGLFGREVSLHTTTALAATLLLGMGGFTLVIAARGTSMRGSGWQADLSARLQHYAHVVTVWAGHVPGWVSAAAVVGLLVALAWIALNQAARPYESGPDEPLEEPDEQDDHHTSEWQGARSGAPS